MCDHSPQSAGRHDSSRPCHDAWDDKGNIGPDRESVGQKRKRREGGWREGSVVLMVSSVPSSPSDLSDDEVQGWSTTNSMSY